MHGKILPPRMLPILPESGLEDGPPAYEEIESGRDRDSLEKGDVIEEEKNGGVKDAKRSDGTSPKTAEGVHGFKVHAKDYGICPLCTKKWVNPSILPSGWVVCWRCGWEAVEDEEDEEEGDASAKEVVTDEKVMEERLGKRRGRKGKCPITGVRIGVGELRRVLV